MSVEDVLAGKLPPELQAQQDAGQIDGLAQTSDEFDADLAPKKNAAARSDRQRTAYNYTKQYMI